jgi:hypothetical protein
MQREPDKELNTQRTANEPQSTTVKIKKPTEPGTLPSQWRLLLTATRDKRLSRGDIAILGEIIDRFYSTKGNSRASLTHLSREANLSRRATVTSTKKLTANGYIKVGRPAAGTRPTEYVPEWDFCPSGEADCIPTRGEADCTPLVNTNSTLEGVAVNSSSTHTYLPVPAYADVQVSREINPHGAAASALDGPDAAPRVEGDEPDYLNLFWQVYPRKHQFPKAEAAWLKLNPSPALARQIIDQAKALAGHYSENPVDEKYIPMPANWITGKRWMEDLPAVYGKPKAKKPITTQQESAPPSPANDNEPAKKLVAIEGQTKKDACDTSWIKLKVVEVGGVADASKPDRWLEICYESADAGQQQQGQKELNSLCSAIGLEQVEDTDELLDKPFVFVDDQISEMYKFYPVEPEAKNAVSQFS